MFSYRLGFILYHFIGLLNYSVRCTRLFFWWFRLHFGRIIVLFSVVLACPLSLKLVQSHRNAVHTVCVIIFPWTAPFISGELFSFSVSFVCLFRVNWCFGIFRLLFLAERLLIRDKISDLLAHSHFCDSIDCEIGCNRVKLLQETNGFISRWKFWKWKIWIDKIDCCWEKRRKQRVFGVISIHIIKTLYFN